MFVALSLQIQKTVTRKTGDEGEGQFHQKNFLRIIRVPWGIRGIMPIPAFLLRASLCPLKAEER